MICNVVSVVLIALVLLVSLGAPLPDSDAQHAFSSRHQPRVVIVNKHLPHRPSPLVTTEHVFSLQTVYHHASPSGPIPGLFRKLDVSDQDNPLRDDEDPPVLHDYPIRARPGSAYRAVSVDFVYDMYRQQPESGRAVHTWTDTMDANLLALDYRHMRGVLPDVTTHRPSVLTLAMMASNAYHDGIDRRGDWYDIGAPWNRSESFGWETDGIRGHVYGNNDKSILIVSFKGSSAGVSSRKDAINDKMLFSCCCAHSNENPKPVCDCKQENRYLCDDYCLESNIKSSILYYDLALSIYKDISDRYPTSTVWLTGHSLGGAVASLVGQTFLAPVVSFGIPGDRFAARRLHLPQSPGSRAPIWHFGHTADPIFTGECSRAEGGCGDFATETHCHTGNVCEWDTVKDEGWNVDIRHHHIQDMIDHILRGPENVFSLPKCRSESPDCKDCDQWRYFDHRDEPLPPHHNPSSTPSGPHTKTATTEPTFCSWW